MTTSALDQTRSGERTEPGGFFGAGRAFGVLLVICGALGLLASWVITIDEFELLKNPNFVPSCSINPILSCGNIMKSAQAKVFGFPNPMIGLVAYPVVICVGMAALAGARFRRWFWLGLQTGSLLGVVFVTWLQYESLYTIGNLCLWCMLAWVVTIATFWYTAVHNVKHGIIPAPAKLRQVVLEFHWAVPVLWYGVIAMLILTRWWSYWSTHVL
ncbi:MULTISPECIES: vitamin K epoxide reductase family protein [Streptomycetaceae]|uniref:Vitamin K epoxide reductase n=1 Tax=Streptantibioticus cattleyicolor (strain ATCC 35852 / DSM 46488 / JCM 4925 / NBRC 14057 / NRRL 8057) TaxID=1003195 RepID=F8K4W5_STREN|nr:MULTISPECIES: vitamin K epoxide reductase family protein [Streptomycetaceae]AEW97684.1 Vitamin K epoxide reductase [Streptantibioticus cattleyicolor NRRL 8057 = DSM 46488]MYS62109.1 Vitamin K epoxide reductase [Streptomyces sp. SID5468]CCB78004.1 putative integral membrane protein [Streptantibioticus cattleyicolor NRRL 8057 = DSM 46488]